MNPSGRHVILYDGVCALCNGLVRFLLPRDVAAVFRYAPIQSAVGHEILTRHGRSATTLDTVYVVRDHGRADEQLLTRSAAAFFALQHARGVWRVLLGFRVLPTSLLDWGYDVIARQRYRVFGRYDACPVPPDRYRARFLDR